MSEQEARQLLGQFRKQCVNKGGGIGFEQTLAELTRLHKAGVAAALERDVATTTNQEGEN